LKARQHGSMRGISCQRHCNFFYTSEKFCAICVHDTESA
jgi:hypothetical protein